MKSEESCLEGVSWRLSERGTVSYVGKANYKEAEQYIRDFQLWTSSAAKGLTEVSFLSTSDEMVTDTHIFAS